MHIIITGSRSWSDREAVRRALAPLPPGTVVIVGDARGADTIAAQEAIRAGLSVVVVSADWATYGRSAGPVRNARMLRYCPALVIAFWDGASSGTLDMLTRAHRIGIRTILITPHQLVHTQPTLPL